MAASAGSATMTNVRAPRTSRPYRPAAQHKHAIKTLKDCSGRQLDREAVDAFLGSYSGRRQAFVLAAVLAAPQQALARIAGGRTSSFGSSAANAMAIVAVAAAVAAAAGTPGEYLTVEPLPSIAGGIRGPIGLGFRVPMLVISPFSRGGLVSSHTFDHTSLLRFLERRFGPKVPNLSKWRRSVTGDMTQAFNFAQAANTSVPTLPSPSLADPRVLNSDCPTQSPGTGSSEFPTVVGYPLPPPPQTMPRQEPGTPHRPSGCATG